jgi:integrase
LTTTLQRIVGAAISLTGARYGALGVRAADGTLASFHYAGPIALVAAWLGHADVSFTLRTYVHAQPDALELAARRFAPPISSAGD